MLFFLENGKFPVTSFSFDSYSHSDRQLRLVECEKGGNGNFGEEVDEGLGDEGVRWQFGGVIEPLGGGIRSGDPSGATEEFDY